MVNLVLMVFDPMDSVPSGRFPLHLSIIERSSHTLSILVFVGSTYLKLTKTALL